MNGIIIKSVFAVSYFYLLYSLEIALAPFGRNSIFHGLFCNNSQPYQCSIRLFQEWLPSFSIVFYISSVATKERNKPCEGRIGPQDSQEIKSSLEWGQDVEEDRIVDHWTAVSKLCYDLQISIWSQIRS